MNKHFRDSFNRESCTNIFDQHCHPPYALTSCVFFFLLRNRTCFCQGLVCVPSGPCLFLSRVPFPVCPAVGASSRVVEASYVLVCRWVLVCVLSGPCLFFEQPHVSVPFLIIWRPCGLRLAAVAYKVGKSARFAPSCPPRISNCHGSQGSWSRADWAVDRQLRTLCAFLDSNSGADFWC